jgi:hypothetical protein
MIVCLILCVAFSKGFSQEYPRTDKSGPSAVELDLTDPASIDLSAYWDTYSGKQALFYTCYPGCPAGLALSSNGQLDWLPSVYNGPSPYRFDIVVKERTPFSANQFAKITVSIDQYAYKSGMYWKRYELNAPEFRALPSHVKDYRFVTGVQTVPSRAKDLGSVTYLGFFNAEHLVITNFHVYAALRESTLDSKPAQVAPCDQRRQFYFKASSSFVHCKKLLFSDPVLDLVLMSVSSSNPLKPIHLGRHAPRIRLDLSNSKSLALVVAGHGRYKNPQGQLSFGFDDDCVLEGVTVQNFSVAKLLVGLSLRLLKSFGDERRKAVAPRLAVACDVSPGDSGGPVILYDTGELIGITVGGYKGDYEYPKPPVVGAKVSAFQAAHQIQKFSPSSSRALVIPLSVLVGRTNYL